MKKSIIPVLLACFVLACHPSSSNLEQVQQWTTYELTFTTNETYNNPYTEVEFWATFNNEKGDTLVRPGFWVGDNNWKIRFSPIDDNSIWHWKTSSSLLTNKDLHGRTGSFLSTPYNGANHLLKHGLLKMSEGKRNVIHHDKHPFLVVADTPWALPFRATTDQAETYADNRQNKSFNAALLMSLQPDMEAVGPDARNTEGGFARAFIDLEKGHINQLQPSYFQYLDSLIDILITHEIVPVFQPVFHGYGWKGKEVLGNSIVPHEYVRYCKYLLARYGSQPAFWLLAADNGGKDPGVKESGIMMEEWDCYKQPTGLHYNPCDDYLASWAIENPLKHCKHFNESWQAENWLDFQWAQTGHGVKHLYHKVEKMYLNKVIKAVANGEPTYEGMDNGKMGLGWWQGEDAWNQLMSGGTMGVVYGAATLWQWKITPEEKGWPAWADQNTSWKEAMDMEGADYVGMMAKIFNGYDYTDMEKRPDLTNHKHPLLAKEGVFYISYLNNGGTITINSIPTGLTYKWFNPKNGLTVKTGTTTQESSFTAPDQNPWVLVIGETTLSVDL